MMAGFGPQRRRRWPWALGAFSALALAGVGAACSGTEGSVPVPATGEEVCEAVSIDDIADAIGAGAQIDECRPHRNNIGYGMTFWVELPEYNVQVDAIVAEDTLDDRVAAGDEYGWEWAEAEIADEAFVQQGQLAERVVVQDGSTVWAFSASKGRSDIAVIVAEYVTDRFEEPDEGAAPLR